MRISDSRWYNTGMFDNLPTPALFAHRGSSAHAPENTLAAFELAIRQGADAIELDAMLCASGEVVVIHDETLERTTDGQGRVSETPLEALRELDAGGYFDPAFRGQRIPTLEEVLESAGGRIYLNLELKNYATPGDALPERVAALVERFGLEEWVLFSSFNPWTLRRARARLPRVPVGLLTAPGWTGRVLNGPLGRFLLPCEALHPEKGAVTPALVESVHRRGRRLHTYTVNSRAEMERLFALGVDGIFSDDPLLRSAAQGAGSDE